MNISTHLFSRLLVPTVLIIAGCRAPVPLPIPTSSLASESTQNEVIRVSEERTDKLQSLRALAVTAVKMDNHVDTLRYVILCDQPEKLRLEALPLHGVLTLQLFTANGSKATLLDVGEKTAYTSNSIATLLKRAIQLPLSAAEVCELIAAAPNLSRLQANAKVGTFYETEGGQAMFVSHDSSSVIVFGVDRRVTEWQLREVGGKSVNATVTYAWDTETKALQSLKLDFDGKAQITMDFARFSENPTLADGLFEAQIPSDYNIKEQ